MNIVLLFLFLISHYLCDFTRLSTPDMLKAKSIGYPYLPILQHALIHTVGMSIAILLFVLLMNKANVSEIKYIGVIILQLISHFTIDTLKGKCNVWFPVVKDTNGYTHWCVFGLDQLLHQVVIVVMWVLIN